MTTEVCEAVNCDQGWHQVDSNRKKFVRIWKPAENVSPWGAVCILHGLGEHSGRYQNLAVEFVRAGLRVYAFDQQGHGHSPEKQACIESYDSVMDDVAAVLAWVQDHARLPTCLFGHSMGGNFVLNYALRRTPHPLCVISSSPMIRAVEEPAAPVETLLRALKVFFPNFRMGSNVRPERLMSDPEEQAGLANDELFHSKLSLRLGASLLDTGRWLIGNAPRLEVPTLLTHGTIDHKTSPEASIEFAASAGSICKLEILDGHYHDPFRDLERLKVIDLFVSYIRQRVEEAS
ncbi:MAG: lysophospholipase [Aureliella sp.]